MSALATVTDLPVATPTAAEELTTSQWAELFILAGISRSEDGARRIVRDHVPAGQARMVVANGGATKVISFAQLKPDWQAKLTTLLAERHARTFTGLLDVVTPTWVPPFSVAEMGDYNTTKAMRVQEALNVYYGLLDQGQPEKFCVLKAAHKYEELSGQRAGFSTVREWVKRVKAAGGHGRAPLQAYGEFKKTPHHSSRLENKLKAKVPFGVAAEAYDFETFKTHLAGLVMKDGMVIMSGALHELEIAWKSCVAIPGLGVRTLANAPFPFTYDQLRRLTPGAAKRKTAGLGKWRAQVDGAFPTVHTHAGEMPLCAEYQLDDTRCDFVVQDRITGLPITLKLYVCLEVCTRRVVAYVVREASNFCSADTAALIARTLRHSGFAARGAGYHTIIRVELGEVAMPAGRADLLEAMFPGQIKVVQTGATRGPQLPGSYSAVGKGNFWQKPHVETFNRTFGFLTRWIPGQRGSDFRHQPATLGTSGVKRKAGKTTGELAISAPGTILAEAAQCQRVARWAAALEHVTDEQLSAAEAEKSTGITGPLLYRDEALEAIDLVIAHYNTRPGPRAATDFQDVFVPAGDGKQRRQKESPNQKWHRVFAGMDARGLAPVRLAVQDVPILLMKADQVTVTPQGVVWGKRRYWQPHSAAVLRAQDNHSHTFQCLALADPENPSEIFLLSNKLGERRMDGSLESRAVLWETLPLAPDANRQDPASMAHEAARVRENHDNQMAGVMRASESIRDATSTRQKANLARLSAIVASSLGCDLATVESKLGAAFRGFRATAKERGPAPVESDPTIIPFDPEDTRDNSDIPVTAEGEARASRRDQLLAQLAAELLAPTGFENEVL